MGLVSIAQPSSKRESTGDKINNALAIANSVLGIVGGVQSIKQKSDEASKAERLADPTSPESVSAREQAKSLGVSIPETVSALQAKEELPLLYQGMIADKKLKTELAQREGDREFQKELVGLRGTEDRKTIATRSSIEKKEKPATSEQFKAGGFAKRIEQAEENFKSLTEKGFDPTSKTTAIESSRFMPEVFKGNDVKLQEQAEKNFINATLRRESGAAISPSEFISARAQYLPQVGDTPEVLDQKAQNRGTVLATLRAEAGPALEKVNEQIQPSLGSKKGGASGGLVPNAVAGDGKKPSFGVKEMAILNEIKKHPNDPNSLKAKEILRSQGLDVDKLLGTKK